MNVMIMTKGNGNEECLSYGLLALRGVPTRIANAKIDSPANKKVTVSDEVAEGLTYGAELMILSISSALPTSYNRKAGLSVGTPRSSSR